ncbi:MAG TPA: acyloxyacyl hydrolase [Patescibacteria group bacterium]|nr:acyloxyacyl hydrolase [Patescibacteria group bacterium]
MAFSVKGLLLVAVAGLMAMAVPAQADDPSYLTIGAGTWETLRNQPRSPELDLAYRSDYKLWVFKPIVGALVATDGDFYGYGGLRLDAYFGPHVVSTVSAAAGLSGGHGFDMGSAVEFREGLDLAWRFNDASRLGVGFYHESNAGLSSHRNPGSESALLMYSLPITKLFSGNNSSSSSASSSAWSTSDKTPTVASTQFSRVNY